MTYYYKPHGTESVGKAPNPGGDLQWYNNLLINRASLVNWDEPGLPIRYDGNVFAGGAKPALDEPKAVVDELFDPNMKLVQKADGWYLSMNVPLDWKNQRKRKQVTTSVLDKAIVPDQAFTNPDGSRLKVDTDYLGNKRNGKSLSRSIGNKENRLSGVESVAQELNERVLCIIN